MNINPKTQQAYTLLHEGVLALSHAEQAGIRVDVDYVEQKKIELTEKIDQLEAEFKATNFFKHWEHSSRGKVNINSDEQLRHFLYTVKKLKPPKLTVSGVGATDKDALQQLNIPELNILLEQSKFKILRDTNLDGFAREQVNGYIHPVFNLHLARTYRSSSDHPNFQNIPIRDEESMQICRGALYPRPGHQLLEIDFKGIEVAVNACYNRDKTLIKYIKDPQSDMHADMTKQIFKLPRYDKTIAAHRILRGATKNGFVFPEFYGDYYKNCVVVLACEWGKLPQGRWHAGEGIVMPEGTLGDHMLDNGFKSLDDFSEHIKTIENDFWNNRFPEYQQWKNKWWQRYQRNGYIDLLTGFRCSGIMGKNDVTNYPAQGSAFHCLLWCFITLDKLRIKEGWDSRLIGQIHDSLIIDILPEELSHISQAAKQITSVDLLNHFDWICVPMMVDAEITPVDCSWATKKKFDL